MLSLKNVEIWTISTMADGWCKITLYTPELPPEQMAFLFLAKKNGIAEAIDVEEWQGDGKTPSQRLRAVLYVYWENFEKNRYKHFNDFYVSWIEKKVDEIKERLPDKE